MKLMLEPTNQNQFLNLQANSIFFFSVLCYFMDFISKSEGLHSYKKSNLPSLLEVLDVAVDVVMGFLYNLKRKPAKDRMKKMGSLALVRERGTYKGVGVG